MKIDIPHFEDKEELFDFLIENKDLHITEKKSELKKADAIHCQLSNGLTIKGAHIDETTTTVQVKSVINTTRVMDSHLDVHIDGIWKKSLRENPGFNLLQEHVMLFDHIISDVDEVKAFTEILSWKSLGFRRIKGDTQALIFDSTIERDRNEFMFDQYAKGFVKNHSVGMRYVKMFLAINSDSNTNIEEKEIWDKYIETVINRKEAEAKGFFWAVTEAKIIEGSAVVKGSNIFTPAISIEAKNDTEPPPGTHKNEPPDGTQKRRRHI